MTEQHSPDTDPTGIEAGKKGRPTPKRKDQEAARRRPVIANTKDQKKAQREKARVQREREYQAMREGDERNMPLEHRGPERRFLRDWVDARTSAGEFLLPTSIFFVLATLVVPANNWIGGGLIIAFYVLVLVVAVDTFIMIRRLKKSFDQKFGWQKRPRGWTFYVIARHLNLRRFRVPKPVVKRGEFPV